MRFFFGLALALALSRVAMAAPQQETTGTEGATGRTQPASVPAANPPAAERKTAESAEKKQAPSGARKRHKHTTSRSDVGPHKVVVREGGAIEPAAQIAPGIDPAEATRERQNTEQLLNSSEDELKRLAARTLDAQHRETVGQIRNYMIGARTALKEGDLQRAGTLAEKAHLLAEDLVTH
ncbi:MAG: hypothetical protein ABSD75_00960 [Terriglobales bacterium]|jgi:hypothetical protein